MCAKKNGIGGIHGLDVRWLVAVDYGAVVSVSVAVTFDQFLQIKGCLQKLGLRLKGDK